MMVEKATQACPLGGLKHPVEVVRRERLAVVRLAAGVDPGTHSLRVAHRCDCPLRLSRHHAIEEFLREPTIEVAQGMNAR